MTDPETPQQTLHRIPVQPWRWLPWLIASQLLVLLLWWQLGWGWGLAALVASHALFVVPVFLPNSRFYAPVVSHLPGPAVWLTIDDGPSDDTLPILDLLDRYDAQATFFMVGERAAARPELVREVLRRGHDLGNHSHSHPQSRFWALGPARMAQEIGACQQALAAIAGEPPRWYRSVVGMTNPFVGAALKRHDLARVGWSARGFDGVGCEPDKVVARIGRDLAPGAIVLLHEGSGHGHNLAIIQAVLQQLQAQGLSARLPRATA
ncbi:polysaccharide deacetylase family protein [Stenotrophomonas sp. SY1]|uniref:polysaccharide deacetylase family protein n=1 Tax=Stenotrophomonas sp. SY1 TaxID=477235 RepID=UPI001E5C7FEE|nr:polysaccharide deacetylase family protein [Stenotrophomonas sp. SY1]MCD9088122.1 polysaccharide deacetylase family protein [Stenotrophomonas sp. SY1]